MLHLQSWLSDAATVLSRQVTFLNTHSSASLHLLAINLHPNRHSYLTVLDDEGLWQQQLYAGVGSAGGAVPPGASCVTLKPGARHCCCMYCVYLVYAPRLKFFSLCKQDLLGTIVMRNYIGRKKKNHRSR